MLMQCKTSDDVSQKMRAIANNYIEFINRLSSGEQFDQHKAASSFLNPNCKKIFNGALITSNSTQFVNALLQLYNTYGSWKITPADILISTESCTVIVRLFADIPSLGHFTEILLMRLDQELKILEINIVFNKVEDGYRFGE